MSDDTDDTDDIIHTLQEPTSYEGAEIGAAIRETMHGLIERGSITTATATATKYKYKWEAIPGDHPYSKFEVLDESVFCPLCKQTTNLSKIGFMGDYRFAVFDRKRCSSCLLCCDSKEWKKRKQLI